VDTLVPEDAAADLLATLREALTNVARHAQASHVDIHVTANRDIALEVIDDGVGPPHHTRDGGRGLSNMQERAAALGGDLLFEPHHPRGARLLWRIPTDQEA